jgi:uncharacterized protein YqjF (DUF2071 family)
VRASRPFLTARWSELLIVTYEVPEALVRRHVHPSLEPDRWEGRTHASLVAFDFLETRVLGCAVPGLVSFPEVNLRTYVRLGGARGVVFIRELVPSPVVAAVARLRYNEPYYAARMLSAVGDAAGELAAVRRWWWRGRAHTLAARSTGGATVPDEGSVEHHFKEHAWGFGVTRAGRLRRYRVDHPVWSVRDVLELHCDVDFGQLYGPEWAPLTGATPASVVHAVGSAVAVFPPTP